MCPSEDISLNSGKKVVRRTPIRRTLGINLNTCSGDPELNFQQLITLNLQRGVSTAHRCIMLESLRMILFKQVELIFKIISAAKYSAFQTGHLAES